MKKEICVCGISQESIVDGIGIRYVVFVQGCPHLCKGCHNPQSHEFGKGKTRQSAEILDDILKNPLLDGVTLSGGEPFCQAEALCSLAMGIKENGLSLWAYSGYTFEEIIKMSEEDSFALKLLSLCDVLVDGRFIEEQKSLELKFRGSKNQRVIDVKKTLKAGCVTEYEF